MKNDELLEPSIRKKKSAPRHHATDRMQTPQMNKKTTNLDMDPSSRSELPEPRRPAPLSADRKPWQKKLTKKETLMYRPSEVENKMLETIVLKVGRPQQGLPEKERYKINVIPCNTNTMSKISMPKSKTCDDIPDKREPAAVHPVSKEAVLEEPGMQKATQRNLELIAIKTKALTRRMSKIRSRRG